MTTDTVRRVLVDLRGSRNYAAIAPEALERVAAWAAARFKKPGAASAAARRKLHQVCGAFLPAPALAKAVGLLGRETPSSERLREACRAVLALHASTAERLPAFEAFYAAVFSRVSPPRSVLDLGCGLHPLGVPWMSLATGCRYEAWDLDLRLVELLNGTLPSLLPGAAAVARDALSGSALPEAELVWLLKTLPSLEQQQQGAGRDLLSRLRAKAVVVSFPSRTLGGRDVGMTKTYAAMWEPVFTETGWIAEPLPTAGELTYLLTRR